MVDSDGDVAGLKAPSWCQRMLAHVADLQSQINRFKKQCAPHSPDSELVDKANAQLHAARESLKSSGRFSQLNGRASDRALANMHEAEVTILRIVPQDELQWQGLHVLAQARLHLHEKDLRLQRLEAVSFSSRGEYLPLAEGSRELAVSALHAAYQAEEIERARVRSFTYIVCAATIVMSLIAVGFAIFALFWPAVGARFCFPPDDTVQNAPLTICPLGDKPTWQGVWFIEFAGMLAAAVAGAVSLRKVRGTSGPFHVASSLLFLRLPVGALTAVVGTLLISGRFFPGLTALDTPSQIIAWAIAFGILQEGVTRTVDAQGQFLLDNVRAPGIEPDGRDRKRNRNPGVSEPAKSQRRDAGRAGSEIFESEPAERAERQGHHRSIRSFWRR
ncbi:hypothetical protein [Streptomyces sp. NPDC005752]|uniref:hypothetical protein n=1 Tax=Streptomyces sp. NPDC005752 TaxID=3157065 RepID=UPI0033F7FC18